MEKAVGRMMSGGKHTTDGDPGYQIETVKNTAAHNLAKSNKVI
jgi:hypothetical protein